MPIYLVRLSTRTCYDVVVEAYNKSDARELAVELWCQSEEPENDFDWWDDGVEAESEVEEVT